MNVNIMTKNELESKRVEIEAKFNEIRDKLASFIESTQDTIKNYTNEMDELSKQFKEITQEIDKRNGNR